MQCQESKCHDADLNAGIINDIEAKEKKNVQGKQILRCYGWATKFVKGDAIASIITTILNIIGGLIIGILIRGEDFGFALQNYTILTIEMAL